MRIAVLSDIHSNLVALDAVLAAAGAVDRVWQLGDVVGYGPDPDGVVDRLREVGAVGVRGNHDAAAVGRIDVDWFNADARRAIEWTRGHVRPDTRTWLADLPEIVVEAPFALVHGSFRDPVWEYVTQSSAARASLVHLTDLGARSGLFGHTHLPSLFRADGDGLEVDRPADGATVTLDDRPALMNPGSVGQPRDGIPEAAWLLLDTTARTVTWHRIAYDIAATQARMRAVGLPERLAARLDFGL